MTVGLNSFGAEYFLYFRPGVDLLHLRRQPHPAPPVD